MTFIYFCDLDTYLNNGLRPHTAVVRLATTAAFLVTTATIIISSHFALFHTKLLLSEPAEAYTVSQKCSQGSRVFEITCFIEDDAHYLRYS